MPLFHDIDLADTVLPKGAHTVSGIVRVDRNFVRAYQVPSLAIKVFVVDPTGAMVAGPVDTVQLAGGRGGFWGFLLDLPASPTGFLVFGAYQSEDLTLTIDGETVTVPESETGRVYRSVFHKK